MSWNRRERFTYLLVIVLALILLSSCGPSDGNQIATAEALAGTKMAQTATASVPTNTPTTPSTATATATQTPTTTPTLEATPFGGGGQIAFSSSRHGNYEIYVMNPDGSNQTRISNTLFNDNEPAWSTDSTQIAFVASLDDGSSGLFVSQADGSNQKLIVQFADNLGSPTWGPEGQIIFWAEFCFSGCDDTCPECAYFVSNKLNIVNSDGSNLGVLDTDIRPSNNSFDLDWFSEGSRIVWGGIIYSIRSGNLSYLIGGVGGLEVAWSPDGSQVAFSRFRDGNYDIYIEELASGEITRLTKSSGFNRNPTWSPDGTKIAFSSNRDGNWEIYVMNKDGTNIVRLTDNPAYDIEPAWAP